MSNYNNDEFNINEFPLDDFEDETTLDEELMGQFYEIMNAFPENSILAIDPIRYQNLQQAEAALKRILDESCSDYKLDVEIERHFGFGTLHAEATLLSTGLSSFLPILEKADFIDISPSLDHRIAIDISFRGILYPLTRQ